MQSLNRTIYFYKIVLEPLPIYEHLHTQNIRFCDYISSLKMGSEISVKSKNDNISNYIVPIYQKENFLFARYARIENFQDTPQTNYYHDNQLVDSLSMLSIERYSFFVININDLTVTALSASDLPPAKSVIQNWLKSDSNLRDINNVMKVVPILSENAFKMISNSSEVLDLKVDYVNTDGHFKDIISYREIDGIENDLIKSFQIKCNFKNTHESTGKISQIINKIFDKKEHIEKLETTIIDGKGHKQIIDILENSITKKITINLDGDFEKDQDKIFYILKSNL